MRLLILLTFLLTFSSYAQDSFSSEDYNVSRNDLETNIFKKDTTANALVIYEYGNSYINKNTFFLNFEYKQKLKILKRDGFEKATIKIYLYNSNKKKEKVTDIYAETQNLVDGKVVRTKLNKDQIFTERYNANYTLVKFTMPNVQEGSVITYRYEMESPFIYKYKGWEFQDDIPKIHSEYHTSIPAIYEYNIKLVGQLPLVKNETGRKNRCIEGGNGTYADCFTADYVMNNIPAFVEEDYMTTRDNYLSKIDYELRIIRYFDGTVDNITKTWETADKELKTDENIGRQLNKNVASNVTIADSILSETNLLKRAKGIYKYVQNNFTWNERYGIYNESSVKELTREKSGSVAEINILLHNLLEEYDIEVSPVLMSTRGNGLPTKIYPVISDFNYLIVQAKINNKTYLLDATDEYLSFGELPFRCLNQYGRKLDFKKGSEWIDIAPKKVSTIVYKAELSVNEDELIEGQLHASSSGYHAIPLKKAYFSNKQDYVNYFNEKNSNIEVIDHSTKTKEKSEFIFDEDFEIEYSPEAVGDNIYINPFIFNFFKENPFKLQERTYPIDFGYKDAYLYNLTLELNDLYEVVEMPESKTFNLPNNTGQVNFISKTENNQVKIYLKINFSKAIYEQEYYSYLKDFMSNVVDIQNNSLIVIKKK
ncbi:DUF3857 domain-containing protein [Hanstruepera marina]|uniref:DUF3857 domain-containing protein n=1 Tax=Hanstruepera marina TaxID=2873265 RepID=UPI001CA6F353|nr:DUF3857 domain-containing protein [Hanstruepera marina]